VLRPHSIDDNCQQVTHSRCEPRRLGLHEARILQGRGSASAEGPEALFTPNLTIAIILGAVVPNASTCGAAMTKHDNMSTRSD
jgi:hypothetical protein